MTSKETEDKLREESLMKSNSDLEYIVSSLKEHTKEQIKIAQGIIKERHEVCVWKMKNEKITEEIDELIRKQGWFDFHVVSFDYFKLIIAGSHNLTYYHTLEIVFDAVSIVICDFCGWRSNTSEKVFFIPEDEKELIVKYNIDKDYQLFKFKTDDTCQDISIAAHTISFNTDTVYYYNKPNLDINERVAYFINRK